LNDRIWHYTIGNHLPSIIADGEIKLATAFVWEGRPVVWFSTNPSWEQTANKGFFNNDGTFKALSKRQTESLGGGLVRIEVCPEAAPYSWNDFLRMSDTPRKIAKALAKRAQQVGSAASLWRVSFEAVTRDKWLAIEVLQEDQWIVRAQQKGTK